MNVRIALLFASVALCGASAEAANPVYTSKTRFRIPYRSEPGEMQRLGAREIRLYVSTDRGVRWTQAMAVAPDAGRFDFEAPGDGEYWFAVRTLDGANRLHPQGNPIDPELKVVVDSTPPELDIQLRQLDEGKIQLSWNAVDANLNPRELRLEYLQPGDANWQGLSILPQASSQTAWTVSQSGVVSVRGTVADMAGNIGRGQNQLRVDMGAAPPRPGVPDLRQPVARSIPEEPEQADRSAPRTPDPFAPAPIVNPGPTPTPADEPAAPPVSNFVSESPVARPDVLGGRYEPVPPQQGASSKVRVVNARRFTIGYQVDDVGPSGVGAVELFITEDGGRKWFKYGVDPDQQSPFDVDVPRDGNYGFAIRVKSGVGLAADPPQPGDAPSITVVCDQSPPTVQMLPPQQGRGDAMNKILVRWKVIDDNPHEKPVSLAFSADANGPWQPITGWQANTGSYVWTIGPGVPPRVFLRVTVRDAAGNLAKADTADPVIIDLARPTARIVDVEAPGNQPAPR